jgi:uncharacterized protein YecE (DUF72 family)
MLRVGTCSWAEKTLIRSGEFYPPEASTAEARLRFYARHFDVVEVDSTYYAIPVIATAALWAERTPPDFVFHIKAYGPLTGHSVDPRTLPKDLQSGLTSSERADKHIYIRDASLLLAVAQLFKESLQPLSRTGKLGVVVFQYPPWFTYSHRNLDFILTCRDLMVPFSVAVEFRHGTWLVPEKRDKVFRFLGEHGLIYVVADEPQFGDLRTVPYVPQVTSGTAYFRFHGRNSENWFRKGIDTALRYAYEYNEEELGGFVPAVRDASAKAAQSYVMFNNCYRASAIRNALRMKDLLARRTQ